MADPREVLSRPAPAPGLSLRYGPLPEHVVDVRLPPGNAPAPLVLVVHGGFWREEYDRAHAGPQAAGLAAAGYVTATVEYRRVGGTGGWPGTFDDIALLADTVPGLLASALPDRVDPARTVLVGHSAGGHLAAWAAARHRLPPSSPWHRQAPLPVAGVVSLAGVLDLAAAHRLRLGAGAAAGLLAGGGEDLAGRLALADPAALLPAGVRTLAVHGTADAAVPVEISRAYVEKAARRGDPCELTELAGVGHFELIDPLTPAWAAVLRAVAALAG